MWTLRDSMTHRKRAVYSRKGGPNVIEIIEEEMSSLNSHQIRIDVHYAGINFADLMMRVGLYGAAPPFPFTPGYEVSGIISEIGNAVENLNVGDAVVAMTRFGGYSTSVDVNPEQCFILDGVNDLVSTAAIPVTYATAHHMLVYLGKIREGDSVLIHHAAGGVGSAAAQIAKAKGAGILVGTASSNKKEFVEQQGMIHVSRNDDFVEKSKSLTNGKGVDHALDPVGGKHLMQSYRALSKGGKLYSFGASSAIPGKKRNMIAALKMWWRMPKFDPLRMMNSNKAVFGVHLGTWENDEIMREQMEDIVEMYRNGNLTPVVDSIFKLDEASEAHSYMHERRNKGKILLDCRN